MLTMRRRMRGPTAALVALALVLFTARTVGAAGPPPVGTWAAGLQAAYNFGVINNAQMVTFMPRVTRVMWVHEGDTPGALSFGIEGNFSRIYETSNAMELGGGLLLRYVFHTPWPVRPYLELGGGMLYSDLRNFSLGSRILFSCAGALGVELPVTESLALTAGYRFRHISNAGQSSQNPGLNSNLFAAGVSFTFD
jgi:hypothetical protein